MNNIYADLELKNKIISDASQSNLKRRKLTTRFPIRRVAQVAAVLILSLALTATGYAIVQHLVERTDSGGAFELVIVHDESQVGFYTPGFDEYEFDHLRESMVNIFSQKLLNFDDYTAAQVNEALYDLLFYSSGVPVNAQIVLAPDGEGYFFVNEGPFYNLDGHLITSITWCVITQDILISAVDKENDPRYVFTYEEAEALFGNEFMIPDIPGFYLLDFYLDGPVTFPDDEEDYSSFTNLIDSRSIYVSYENDSAQSIFYFAERLRDVGIHKYEWRVTGTIQEFQIGKVTVYMQRDSDGEWGRYLWKNKDIVYCLFYSDRFNLSDDEYIMIIKNLLR